MSAFDSFPEHLRPDLLHIDVIHDKSIMDENIIATYHQTFRIREAFTSDGTLQENVDADTDVLVGVNKDPIGYPNLRIWKREHPGGLMDLKIGHEVRVDETFSHTKNKELPLRKVDSGV